MDGLERIVEQLREHQADLNERQAALEAERDVIERALAALEDAPSPTPARNGSSAPPAVSPARRTIGPPRTRVRPASKPGQTKANIAAIFEGDHDLILTPAEVAQQVGVSVSAVNAALPKLAREGVVAKVGFGRYRSAQSTAPVPATGVPLDSLPPMSTQPFTQEHARSVAGGGLE